MLRIAVALSILCSYITSAAADDLRRHGDQVHAADTVNCTPPTPQELSSGKPGDYGYLHELFHRCGTVDDLRMKVFEMCCDSYGECRATYIDLKRRKVFLNGRWGDIPDRARMRFDVPIPVDGFAMVCASKYDYFLDWDPDKGPKDENGNPFPYSYCIAVNTDT